MNVRALILGLLCLSLVATSTLGMHSHVGAHDTAHGHHGHALVSHAAQADGDDHEHDLYRFADMTQAHLLHHLAHGDGDLGAQKSVPAKTTPVLALLFVLSLLLFVTRGRTRVLLPARPAPRAAARSFLLPPSQAPPCTA